jgi:hypothetical protein
MENILKKTLQPLYEEMIKNTLSHESLYTFCVQWGKKFPIDTEKQGVLFIGKATNGWVSDSRDIELLFGESKQSIFARKDQIEWVANLEKNKNGYNTSKSSFWRVIKAINGRITKGNNWHHDIAWSNLYKMSFKKGNPNTDLKRQQFKYCKEILKSEINILSPKFVILFTSNWEKPFLKFLNNNTEPIILQSKSWNGNTTKLYEIDGVYYVSSVHPQGKNESQHVQTILELISNYK